MLGRTILEETSPSRNFGSRKAWKTLACGATRNKGWVSGQGSAGVRAFERRAGRKPVRTDLAQKANGYRY
jgi:hypothetical protein